MKYLAWFSGIIGTLLGGIYIIAFTSFGNLLVQDIIEEKIVQLTKLQSKLTMFSLTMSDFEILLELNKNNTILVKGNYSLFSQTFNILYRLNLEELNTLKTLTQTQLNSSFHTDGTIRGNMAFIEIDGKSDLASSGTTYHIELTDLNPTSIIAKIDNADLKSLLYMLNQKAYASAEINLDINFKNIKPQQLDGNIILVTKNGKLNSKVMKKDFNITVPSTMFSMNFEALLNGNNIDYTYRLSSNLAKITSGGKIRPSPLNLDIKYVLNIKELAVLKPITGADVRGALRLNGNVKGTKEKLVVDGKSDFASSDTSFVATLNDFTPSRLKASMKNIKLQRVLYMLKQPHYADGIFSLNVDISDARVGQLKGKVSSSLTKGLVDSKYMTKTYEFTTMMPRTTFNMKTETVLNGNIIETKLDFNSNLANLDVKRARFNISDSSVVSDYFVKVSNLDKLYFVTDRHIKGGIAANGELRKAKDLDLIIHSKVGGGTIDATLHNDDFHADLKSLQTLDILDMLIYPKVFKSFLSGVLDYNLAKQKGVMKGDLVEGKFTKNKVLDLTKKYAKTDLYKEIFKGNINADINRENIITSLSLKSNNSSIVTKNTKLNSKTQQIKSKIDINANGNKLSVMLKGDVNSPKVSVDASQIIQEQVTKEIHRLLKDEDTQKAINRFFKGLF